jgi:hypothetical protein
MSPGDPPRHSRSLLKKNLERANLRVTIASTIIAVAAASAAFWSSWETRQTRLTDERPFLGADVVAPPGPNDVPFPSGNDLAYFRTHLVASGRTPAKKVHVLCATSQSRPLDWRNIDWSNLSIDHYTINFPYILPAHSVEIACSPLSVRPSEESFRVKPAFELGVIQYTGEGETPYQTPFCYELKWKPLDSPPLVNPCHENYGLPELR